MKLKDGPREKLEEFGVKCLKDEELLAILLKTGNKNESVLDLSRRILNDAVSIKNLNDYSFEELMVFKGIGKAKAMTIVSALELSKRLDGKTEKPKYIKCPRDIFTYLKDDYKGLEKERLIVLYLDSSYKVVYKYLAGDGNFNSIILDEKEIVKRALKLNAVSVCLAHNHPSGLLYPSLEDENVTESLKRRLLFFNIDLFDHLIITDDDYYSFFNHQKL